MNRKGGWWGEPLSPLVGSAGKLNLGAEFGDHRLWTDDPDRGELPITARMSFWPVKCTAENGRYLRPLAFFEQECLTSLIFSKRSIIVDSLLTGVWPLLLQFTTAL